MSGPGSVWVVIDEDGMPCYVTCCNSMAQDHINDAIQEHDIVEAAHWVVREYTLATPPKATP